jgi:hypothetical protein
VFLYEELNLKQIIRLILIYVISEVITTMTMKNAVLWDKKTQFVPHMRHITSPLQSPAGYCYVAFEVLTVVTMMNAVSCDMTPCGLWKNRRFGETYRPHQHGDKHSVLRLLVTGRHLLTSLILVTVMIEAVLPPKRQFFQEPHGVISKRRHP